MPLSDIIRQFYYFVSLSSKISSHSGQNFGGCAGASGSQPHLSHLKSLAPTGFFASHDEQNLPLFIAAQEQVRPSSEGFFSPQEEQNLPVFGVWHFGHSHVPSATEAGFFEPQI